MQYELVREAIASKSRLTYDQIGGTDGALANLEPFKGHSMHARSWPDMGYFVWSYDLLIAKVITDIDGMVYKQVLDTHYSKTSRRHVRLCQRYLPPSIIVVGSEAGTLADHGDWLVYA